MNYGPFTPHYPTFSITMGKDFSARIGLAPQAPFKMRKPVVGGKPPRDRAFARSGRTVDGDVPPKRFPGRIARDLS